MTTPENIEQARAEMQPGELWVRVRGPGVDKLTGEIEWRLRQLAEQGYDVTPDRRGRPRKLTDEECIEAARMKDGGATHAEIGKHFNWPLQADAYTNPTRKCRKSEKAVAHGRKLRDANA